MQAFNQSISQVSNSYFGNKEREGPSENIVTMNDSTTKLSDVSREFRELNKEIYKTIQQAGDTSGVSNANNNTNGSIGVFLDDTWLNKVASPDTSENFQLKVHEFQEKEKSKTPSNKVHIQKTKHTFINNPKKMNQFRGEGGKIQPLDGDDLTDEIPSTVEEIKINPPHINQVKQNNLSELNNHFKRNVHLFTQQTNKKNNSSTRLSTNESNESCDSPNDGDKYATPVAISRYQPSNFNFLQSSHFQKSSSVCIPVNNGLGGCQPYPMVSQTPNGIFSPNMFGNYYQNTIMNSQQIFGSLPENAFTYNSEQSKCMSDRKKTKKAREEFDQALFTINLEQIICGQDIRTTIMIRHIPNKYSSQSLLDEINSRFKGKYDFFYLPMDHENQCNLGYAFINFVDCLHIIHFYHVFKSRKWKKYKSHKECDLTYAKFQGKLELTSHLEKSCMLNKLPDDKKPLIISTPDPLPKIEIPLEYSEIFKSYRPDFVNKTIFLNQ